MNWNPTYSPVWKWMRDHAGAALAVAIADPAFVSAIAGPYAPQVTMVIGALTAIGALGNRYAKLPETK